MLGRTGSPLPADAASRVESLPREWRSLQKKLLQTKEALAGFITHEAQDLARSVKIFHKVLQEFRGRVSREAPFERPELGFGPDTVRGPSMVWTGLGTCV